MLIFVISHSPLDLAARTKCLLICQRRALLAAHFHVRMKSASWHAAQRNAFQRTTAMIDLSSTRAGMRQREPHLSRDKAFDQRTGAQQYNSLCSMCGCFRRK